MKDNLMTFLKKSFRLYSNTFKSYKYINIFIDILLVLLCPDASVIA